MGVYTPPRRKFPEVGMERAFGGAEKILVNEWRDVLGGRGRGLEEE